VSYSDTPIGTAEPPPGSRRFEYVRMQISTSQIIKTDEALNELGEAGWELVCSEATETYLHFWFKREKR
jgi:hypothetical protein